MTQIKRQTWTGGTQVVTNGYHFAIVERDINYKWQVAIYECRTTDLVKIVGPLSDAPAAFLVAERHLADQLKQFGIS